MNLRFPQLLIGAVGAILIFAAVKGETPVKIVQDALSNNAKPSGRGTGGTPGTEAPEEAAPPGARFKGK